MLLKDYGKIIIIGLCNSPNHLKEHFEREVLKLSEKHYGRKEVEDNLRQVLEMHKARIKEIYEKDMTRYKEYSEQDKALHPHEKYSYPCPELNEISLTHLDFPSAGSNVFPDGRKYTIVDFANVEAALNEVFSLQHTETKTEQEIKNDFTLSTIEDWLFEFKEKMNEADYQNLVSALIQYFETGIFPKLSKPIQINGRPNKKLFGWALNRIFEAKGKGVEKELLQFAKQYISLFTDVKFDERYILKSNLYKYFTTKIQ